MTIDPAQYDQDPGCDDVAPCHRTNLTGRIGRWGARHRKTAIFGWLAFVVASFFIGSSVVGAKQARTRRACSRPPLPRPTRRRSTVPAPVADDVDGTFSGGVRQPSRELGGAGRLDRSVTVTADSPRVVDRTELVVFLVAVGLVALHVVDDNFLQPQPGTSQTDHLFSGLVPLALLLSAAVVYRRARAGVPATLALPLASSVS